MLSANASYYIVYCLTRSLDELTNSDYIATGELPGQIPRYKSTNGMIDKTFGQVYNQIVK